MNKLTEYLQERYEEVSAVAFYRDIFPAGELEEKGVYQRGKYCGIAVEVVDKDKVKRYSVTDELSVIEELQQSDNFCLMSPISYAGKARRSENARFLYALAFDLDGIRLDVNKKYQTPSGMTDLFYQFDGFGPSNWLPVPTYIVSSGTGLHLYYVLKKPIPLFKNIVEQLKEFKRELTRRMWNGFVTELEDNVQYESIFQGFRVVGTITKKGERARAFKIGEKVDFEYLNRFVWEKARVTDFAYKSDLTLAEAKDKYPDWFERRIVKKEPRKHWTVNRAVYDWWKSRLPKEAHTGHRYYCMMMLAVYARKAGISFEELEKDAFELLPIMEKKTDSEDNHFDEGDVLDALEAYNDRYITYPIESITALTDIPIEKNRRNGRPQKIHLQIARATRDILHPDGWQNINGRPSAEQAVKEWRAANPNGKPKECIAATGLNKNTVYKWWQKRA